jgi:RNase P/RNase MRP subunit POP5
MMKNRKTTECILRVRSEPPLEDPRELHTILLFSIRKLWGELEPHSRSVTVERSMNGVRGDFVIECAKSSVAEIRAALMLVSPPEYLQDAIYRFDVVKIEDA